MAAQAHLGPPDLEEIKITCAKKVKEFQSDRLASKELPAVPYLWGQRLRDRENEFASNFKYGTVYLVRPLISIE